MSEYTIAVLRGREFSRVVARTFKNDETALRWRNKQNNQNALVRLPGRWKSGDIVPLEVRPEGFDWQYTSGDVT